MIHLLKSKRTKAAESKIRELEKKIQILKTDANSKDFLLNEYREWFNILNNQNQNQEQSCTEQNDQKTVLDEQPTEQKTDAKLSDELKPILKKLAKVKMSTGTAAILGLGCIMVSAIAIAADSNKNT